MRSISNEQIDALINKLTEEERNRLVASMDTIRAVLTEEQPEREYYVIRSHRPGDIGFVIHRHGVLYAREFGFNDQFDAYVAEGMSHFINTYDADKEHLWIAETNGATVGSVAIVKAEPVVAQLRWLYVEPTERRKGGAGKLLNEAILFAKRQGYSWIILWTIDFLHAARTLYSGAGFQLVEIKKSDVGGGKGSLKRNGSWFCRSYCSLSCAICQRRKISTCFDLVTR